ncbi:hypothetical protein GCM10010172_43010 [Paractinoplanes ferrugineus]|uniref:Uncharacterized protein n=1 Tax=Paractinoplanes ferrugineus TaxID=113564 RepID=A0A919MG44_9ACTN|nr:hypothetical protein Afe05nite_52990 [Actinoplanes ferrugineus]
MARWVPVTVRGRRMSYSDEPSSFHPSAAQVTSSLPPGAKTGRLPISGRHSRPGKQQVHKFLGARTIEGTSTKGHTQMN